jgi:hypothetical protein
MRLIIVGWDSGDQSGEGDGSRGVASCEWSLTGGIDNRLQVIVSYVIKNIDKNNDLIYMSH